MITYPAGSSSPGAGTRIKLLDVQTVDGDVYYWADRAVRISAAVTADNNPAVVNYDPWLLSAGPFKLYRSMQSDTGKFTIQNVSGNTVTRDFERIVRRSSLEGALYVLRYWQVDGAYALRSWQGTLSVSSIDYVAGRADLTGKQLIDGSDDTPYMQLSETCQLIWGEKRCGATGNTECLYTAQTCQVPERFTGLLVDFTQKNLDPTLTSVAITPPNRRRSI